jgi:hypothetical protein
MRSPIQDCEGIFTPVARSRHSRLGILLRDLEPRATLHANIGAKRKPTQE